MRKLFKFAIGFGIGYAGYLIGKRCFAADESDVGIVVLEGVMLDFDELDDWSDDEVCMSSDKAREMIEEYRMGR